MFQDECGYQNGGSFDLEKLLTEQILKITRTKDGKIAPYMEKEEHEEIENRTYIYFRQG